MFLKTHYGTLINVSQILTIYKNEYNEVMIELPKKNYYILYKNESIELTHAFLNDLHDYLDGKTTKNPTNPRNF